MAVKIRLTRTGRKKFPSYRVVIADSEAPCDGRFIEKVGTYNPRENPVVFQVDEQLVLRWLGMGAQPTETVRSLLKNSGLWKKFLDGKREKAAS